MPSADRNHDQELQRLRREEFVVTEEKTWFDISTYGPLSVSNVRAQESFLEGQMRGSVPKGIGHWREGAAEVRGKVGTLIGCDLRDVALLPSTGEGLGPVLLGLDWKNGDEVIIYDNEFPSGVYPWLALERCGVVIRFIEDRGRHRFDAEDVEARLSAKLASPSRSLCEHLKTS